MELAEEKREAKKTAKVLMPLLNEQTEKRKKKQTEDIGLAEFLKAIE